MSTARMMACSYYPPAPDRDSGSRRLLDLLNLACEAGWSVTFVAANGIPEPRYARALGQRGIPVFDASAIRMEELLEAGQFDVVLFSFWQVAEFYLPFIRSVSPSTRVIVDSVDLQFIREARRTFSQVDHRALLGSQYGDQAAAELNVYAAADAVITVSDPEAQVVRMLLGDPAAVHTVPDIEELSRSTIPFAQRRGVVFIGSFRHPPNTQAVEYLCTEVVPRLDPALLHEHPIYVVGDGLGDILRSFADTAPAVRMVGRVPSVLPYLERSRVSVVPLRYGAGTKRKMLQALMVGTPVVSTSIGVEGLQLCPGEHALVADDADSFATAMAELLQNELTWQQIADNGVRHVARWHSPRTVRGRFLQVIDSVMREARPRPQLPLSDEDAYQRRVQYQYHQQIIPLIRRCLVEARAAGSVVAVITEGAEELLDLGVTAWHFPRNPDGSHPGTRPASSSAAISHLEELRRQGVEYLVVPGPALWWLDHFEQFASYLEEEHFVRMRHGDDFEIFSLTDGSSEEPTRLRQSTAGETEVHHSSPPYHTARAATHDGPPEAPTSPEVSTELGARLIAFYLPQFHPIPENDKWWGEGFTEWTNVAKAEPLYSGHEQPHLPADLGFYDLRLAETREAQADLARSYGISAFCYYHYWFHGSRLLDRPFAEILETGRPDFPFCLCWANEPWSRRWDGRPHDVLQQQDYSEEDDKAHIRWLLPALRDPRALTIQGRPVFLVYQAKDLPDPARTVELWRTEARRAGVEDLYLMTVETGWDAGWDATDVGFDAKVLFQPQFSILDSIPRLPGTEATGLRVYDYSEAWQALAHPPPVPYRRYETVCPRWDNSPRTGSNAVVLHGSTPEAYEEWLRLAVERVQDEPEDRRLVFLNAWNEWGEGCHLEPDMRHGHAYLAATRKVATRTEGPVTSPRRSVTPPVLSDRPAGIGLPVGAGG